MGGGDEGKPGDGAAIEPRLERLAKVRAAPAAGGLDDDPSDAAPSARPARRTPATKPARGAAPARDRQPTAGSSPRGRRSLYVTDEAMETLRAFAARNRWSIGTAFEVAMERPAETEAGGRGGRA